MNAGRYRQTPDRDTRSPTVGNDRASLSQRGTDPVTRTIVHRHRFQLGVGSGVPKRKRPTVAELAAPSGPRWALVDVPWRQRLASRHGLMELVDISWITPHRPQGFWYILLVGSTSKGHIKVSSATPPLAAAWRRTWRRASARVRLPLRRWASPGRRLLWRRPRGEQDNPGAGSLRRLPP